MRKNKKGVRLVLFERKDHFIAGNSRAAIARLAVFIFIFSGCNEAIAYPQFQEYAEKHSGQAANCAMCHSNGNGPTGTGPGQIGGLNEDELKKLDEARKAFEPGEKIDSPILNEFGNKIIEKLGRKEVIALVKEPARLADKLGKELDTDHDGIPDAEEYLDGTDPNNRFHGNPWKLFLVNLDRYKQHILLTIAAVLLLNFGLGHLIEGIALITEKR